MKSELTHNSRNQIELRRNQNILMIVGTGTISFGLWSLAKALGFVFMKRGEFLQYINNLALISSDDNDVLSDHAIFAIVFATVVIAFAVDMIIRLYVGSAAISEGKGKRRGRKYIFLTCLMILGSVVTLASSLYGYVLQISSEFTDSTAEVSISSIIIEFTSLIMLIEMLAASVRVRKLSGRGRHAKE